MVYLRFACLYCELVKANTVTGSRFVGFPWVIYKTVFNTYITEKFRYSKEYFKHSSEIPFI